MEGVVTPEVAAAKAANPKGILGPDAGAPGMKKAA
jgi:hypothetical protein